jgi:hypothetical protein
MKWKELKLNPIIYGLAIANVWIWFMPYGVLSTFQFFTVPALAIGWATAVFGLQFINEKDSKRNVSSPPV